MALIGDRCGQRYRRVRCVTGVTDVTVSICYLRCDDCDGIYPPPRHASVGAFPSYLTDYQRSAKEDRRHAPN